MAGKPKQVVDDDFDALFAEVSSMVGPEVVTDVDEAVAMVTDVDDMEFLAEVSEASATVEERFRKKTPEEQGLLGVTRTGRRKRAIVTDTAQALAGDQPEARLRRSSTLPPANEPGDLPPMEEIRHPENLSVYGADSVTTRAEKGEGVWFTQGKDTLWYGAIEKVTGFPPEEVVTVIREDGEIHRLVVANIVGFDDRDFTNAPARKIMQEEGVI